MSRTVAIGDIHGCSRALEVLLSLVSPTPNDTVVTLGDCVAKGPNSFRVLEVLEELSHACKYVPLLGNHDAVMAGAINRELSAQTWLRMGGDIVLRSYPHPTLDSVTERHGTFLNSFQLYHETSTHLYVHACYEPNLSLSEHSETTLLWENLGDTLPAPHYSGKTVVLGHTPQKSGLPLITNHLICLDTNCVNDGWLTAMDIDSGRIWQAAESGKVQQWHIR